MAAGTRQLAAWELNAQAAGPRSSAAALTVAIAGVCELGVGPLCAFLKRLQTRATRRAAAQGGPVKAAAAAAAAAALWAGPRGRPAPVRHPTARQGPARPTCSATVEKLPVYEVKSASTVLPRDTNE